MTSPALIGVAYAEANHGRWVARCPRPWCTNAVQLDRDQSVFACLGVDGCGEQVPVQWPADPDAIEALLVQRPVSATRNWIPGEPLSQLVAENAQHGILPPGLDPATVQVGEAVDLLSETDGRPTSGLALELIETYRIARSQLADPVFAALPKE